MYKTMEEIEKESNGQWVFMVDCKKDKYNAVKGSEVVFHHVSMNTVLKNMKMSDKNGNSTYVRYIGVLPEGAIV